MSHILQPGHLLSNRFRIEARIGEGEQTVVYRAFDISQNRTCAVKIIDSNAGGNRLRRFMREFEELSRLEHPFLIRAYDFVEDPHRGRYYSCELIEGEPVNRRYESFKIEYHLPLMVQICEIFKYLHTHGIIHGDVKPASLLVTSPGEGVQATDRSHRKSLGVLAGAAFQDETRQVVGTIRLTGLGLMEPVPFSRDTVMREAFHYIAPEVVLARKYDVRADIYSLGVIFYQLVTGELPYSGESLLSLVKNRLRLEPLTPHEINRDIPPRLEQIILRCLKRRPADRYQVVEEMLYALSTIEQEAVFSDRQVRYSLHPLTSEFLDREKERETVDSILNTAAKGQGHIVLIGGEQGIGKSRFLQEIKTHAQLQGFLAFSAECSERFSYRMQPIVELIQQALLQMEKQFSDKIEAYGRETRTSESGTEDGYSRSQSDGADTRADGPDESDEREFEREESRLAIESSCQLFIDLAREVPILLLIDDAHRADAGTIDFLQLLAEEIDTSALLICLAYRRDMLVFEEMRGGQRHPLRKLIEMADGQAPVHSLIMNRFTRENTARLMSSLLNGIAIGSDVLDFCFRETDGIPELIVEMVQSLLTRGIIVQDDRGSFLVQEFDRDTPVLFESLTVSLQQRLEMLDETESYLVELFSLFKHGVETAELAAISGYEASVIEKCCRRLSELELVQVHHEHHQTLYRIARQYLIHYIRRQSSETRIRELHCLVADYYQGIVSPKVPATIVRLAWHAARCRPELPETLRYAIQAAEYYIGLGDIRKALDHYQDLRPAMLKGFPLEEADISSELLFRPGELLIRLGELKKALDWYRSLNAMLESREESLLLAALFMRIGTLYLTIGFYERALNNYHSAIGKVTSHGEHPLLAVLYGHIAICYLFLGQSDTSRDYSGRSLRIIERFEDLPTAAEVYYLRGSYLVMCGEYVEASRYLLRSLKLKELLNDHTGEGRVCIELGRAHLSLANADQAEDFLNRALTIFESHPSRHDRYVALVWLAEVHYLYSGNWEKSLRIHRDIESMDLSLLDPYEEGLRLIHLGNLSADMGSEEQAAGCFERCLELFTRMKISIGEALIYHAYGQWYLDQGDLVLAEEFLRKSESLFSTLGFEAHLQRVRLTHTVLDYRKKDYQAAREQLEVLVQHFENNSLRYELGIALRIQAMVAMEQDHLDFARGSLRTSEQLFKVIDSEVELAKTYHEMSKSFYRADQISRANNYAQRAATMFTKIGARKHLEKLETNLQHMRESTVHYLYGIEEKKGEMATLYQMSQYITSILDLKTLSERLLDMVTDAVKAERGLLILTDRNSNDLQIKVARNFAAKSLDAIDDFSRKVVHDVIARRTPVLTGDIASDHRFQSNLSVALFDIRSIICVPLIVRDNIIGVLYIDSRDPKNIFTERELNFLVALGNHAAIALQNALLYQQTKGILEGIRDGLLTINQAGIIISLNRTAEKILDIIDSDVVGNTVSIIFNQAWSQELLHIITTSMETRTNTERELYIQPPGKRNKYLAVTTSITSNGYGDLTGVIVLLRDIDRIKKLQEEIDLQQRLASMGELAAKVAHRMKNLLSGIKILSQGLARECEGTEFEEEIVGEMLLEVDEAEKYVYQSLNPSTSLEQSITATSLHQVIDHVLMQLKPQIAEKNINLVKELSPDIPLITINEELIAEALINLCVNALEAMSASGTLTVRMFPEAPAAEPAEVTIPHVVIQVADTGCGIPEEIQEKILEPFFTTKEHGSGVGLWLVHKLVTSYRGRINIQSAPGAGTTFTLILPLKQETLPLSTAIPGTRT